jgi:hypothetical protein
MLFAPGASKIGIATLPLPSLRERSEYSEAPSSTRAMSRMRVSSPRAPVLTITSPNSSADSSRPCRLIDSWKSETPGCGGAPIDPAETWMFCSRSACTTSPAEMPREAVFSGSSQIRIE